VGGQKKSRGFTRLTGRRLQSVLNHKVFGDLRRGIGREKRRATYADEKEPDGARQNPQKDFTVPTEVERKQKRGEKKAIPSLGMLGGDGKASTRRPSLLGETFYKKKKEEKSQSWTTKIQQPSKGGP